ncbi:helix-turn-helix domain-containing protein [Kiritimatiellota bacterium B12222]|nr:helix-turn-helix domain-containing protein [Kiritimatiellota bacterium B12222]
MNNKPKSSQDHQVPSVEKAIQIIHCLGEANGEAVSSPELAEQTKSSTSTCYRILKTLTAAGWVRGDGEKGYRLGAGLLGVLRSVNFLQEIATSSEPVLTELALETGMTAKLSIRQDRNQVTLAAGQPRVPLAVLAPVGVPYPVVQASSGAILLARLNDTEIEKIISQASDSDWGCDSPEILRQRIDQFRNTGQVENIGFNAMGLDSLACGISHPHEQLALTMIGLRGEFTANKLPSFQQNLLATQNKLETLFVSQP